MIIGLTGTLGAGKNTAVEYLVSKGWKHYSGGDIINAEVVRRKLPMNRDSMSLVANDLRARHGSGYLIEKSLDQARAVGGDAVIESLHSIGESNAVRAAGGLVVAVDADIALRFERIRRRGSAKDNITFEKFVADNAREAASSDTANHNLLANIEGADFLVTNDGTVEDLLLQIDDILRKVKK